MVLDKLSKDLPSDKNVFANAVGAMMMSLHGSHERPWALAMALEVAVWACLVASMGFLDEGTFFLGEHFGTLGKLFVLLVHPVFIELRALGAVCILAFVVAGLDLREVLARFHYWLPRFGALLVAIGIRAALLVAFAGDLHPLAESVHVRVATAGAVPRITVVVVEHRWARVMALHISRLACLVASVGLLNLGAFLLGEVSGLLGVPGILLVHPLLLKLGAFCSAVFIFACIVACLDLWPVLARLHDGHPWFWTLLVTVSIVTTSLMALMSLLHLLSPLLHRTFPLGSVLCVLIQEWESGERVAPEMHGPLVDRIADRDDACRLC